MRKFLVFFSLMMACSSVFASEQYQMANAVGVWIAQPGSGVFTYFDLLVTPSADGKSLRVVHCTLAVEHTGKCSRYDSSVGVGTYSEANDNIEIVESDYSGTPVSTYTLTVDSNDSRDARRSVGSKSIGYYKIR